MKSTEGHFRIVPALILSFFGAALTRGVELVAHRGASFDAPENTVAAQELAWRHGADAAEFDVRATRDGELAIMHDATTKRTTGREAQFGDLTLAELRQLDAGRWKGAPFAGEKVPTLDEMLQHIAPGKRVILHLYIGVGSIPGLVAALERNHLRPTQAAIISFDFAALTAVRKALPEYQTLWLVNAPSSDPKKKSPTLDELIRDCRTAGFSGLSFNQDWPLDTDAVKKLKAAGLLMHVWTVDLPQIAHRWIELGVDSITTNRAGWLRGQLKL
jgi:glycerophosphoryl diester phosphodiesterase